MKKISKAIEILKDAKSRGINISFGDGQLKLKYSKDKVIDSQLLEEIKKNKELIIGFLSDNLSKSDNEDDSENLLLNIKRESDQLLPLSFSQERLWFIDRLDSSSIQYHIKAVLRIKGKLNTDALSAAMKSIVERHEAVRTVFREEDGKVYQHIKDAGNWNMTFADGSEFKNDPAKLKEYIKNLISKPFDLSKDYMLRAELISLNKDEYMIVATMHHIASDGWSRSVLIKELAELYKNFDEGTDPELMKKPLTVQYADYALWQRQYLSGEILERKLDYWKKKLEGVTPLQLPSDF